jgi:hypothetical protein
VLLPFFTPLLFSPSALGSVRTVSDGRGEEYKQSVGGCSSGRFPCLLLSSPLNCYSLRHVILIMAPLISSIKTETLGLRRPTFRLTPHPSLTPHSRVNKKILTPCLSDACIASFPCLFPAPLHPPICLPRHRACSQLIPTNLCSLPWNASVWTDESTPRDSPLCLVESPMFGVGN